MKQIISIIIASVMVISCSSSTEKKEETKTVKVTVNNAKLNSEFSFITYPGEVESESKSLLSTKLMGNIVSLNKEEGDIVKQGEVIIKINNKDLKAKKRQLLSNKSEAELALVTAEKDYNRFKVLYSQNSASQKEFENIETRYKVTKQKVETINQMLDEMNETLKYSEIKSPFNGVITKKFVNQGDIASPGMPLIAVEKKQEFKIISNIPEADINRLKTGDTVIFSVPAIKLNNKKAVISHINPSGSFTGNSYQISVKPLEDYNLLKSGMFANLKLRNKEKSKLLVPQSAIVKKGQLSAIWTISSKNTAILRWIRTGKSFNDKVEILSGLANGEKYITSSNDRLYQGMKVQSSMNNVQLTLNK